MTYPVKGYCDDLTCCEDLWRTWKKPQCKRQWPGNRLDGMPNRLGLRLVEVYLKMFLAVFKESWDIYRIRQVYILWAGTVWVSFLFEVIGPGGPSCGKIRAVPQIQLCCLKSWSSAWLGNSIGGVAKQKRQSRSVVFARVPKHVTYAANSSILNEHQRARTRALTGWAPTATCCQLMPSCSYSQATGSCRGSATCEGP